MQSTLPPGSFVYIITPSAANPSLSRSAYATFDDCDNHLLDLGIISNLDIDILSSQHVNHDILRDSMDLANALLLRHFIWKTQFDGL